MSDSATKSLDRILKDYVRVPSVALFDAHDEEVSDREANHPDFDDTFVVRDQKTGKLVRRFDKKALEALAKTGRDRQEETGDLSPIGPGHTLPDERDPKSGRIIRKIPETEQPPVWGYAANWRVERYGPGGKLAVMVDLYARPQFADQVKNEYPRRSVELWTNDKLIDWIALLKRCPKRDLGMIAAQRSGFRTQRIFTQDSHTAYSRSQRRGTCLRYAMGETAMPMPPKGDLTDTLPGEDEDELDPESKDTAERYMRHYVKNHPHMAYAKKCYEASMGGGAAPAMPSATNGAMPGGVDEEAPPPPTPEMDEPERMARLQARATHYQRKAQDGDRRNQANEERLAKLEKTTRLQRYHRELTQLARAGFRFDVDKKLARCANYSDVAFEELKADIVENYERDLTRVPDVPVLEDTVGPEGLINGELTERHVEIATQYARDQRATTGKEPTWQECEQYARRNYARAKVR